MKKKEAMMKVDKIPVEQHQYQITLTEEEAKYLKMIAGAIRTDVRSGQLKKNPIRCFARELYGQLSREGIACPLSVRGHYIKQEMVLCSVDKLNPAT